MSDLVYIYDGTIEGFFSAVFHAYEYKEIPVKIATENGLQTALGQSTVQIFTDSHKAERVRYGFQKKAGSFAYERLRYTLLSNEEDFQTIAYNFIRTAMKAGSKVTTMLAHPNVLPVMDLYTKVSKEAQLMDGIVRFAHLENGTYFSKIKPKSNLLPIIMPHFVDRFSIQPFVIYDENNKLAGVYDLKTWVLVDATNISPPPKSASEAEFVALWRHFCDTIAIKERINRKLQISMCAKRFWSNMIEMQPDMEPRDSMIVK